MLAGAGEDYEYVEEVGEVGLPRYSEGRVLSSTKLSFLDVKYGTLNLCSDVVL